ncbi:MAG: hypothetical protein ACRD0G_06355 [Acidimicrobiales bacterium]
MSGSGSYRRALAGAALATTFVLGMPGTASADTEVGNLPGGTGLAVSIDSPADGALVASAAANPLTFTGQASVGQAAPVADTTLIYVIDVSGSTTASSGGCGADANGDGFVNRVLDCEVAALQALNQAAISAGTVDEVGVVAFATNAAIGDVGPAAGAQTLTHPSTDANGNSRPDVEDVLTSARFQPGRLTAFTPVTVGDGTNFEAAAQRACSLAQSSTNPNTMVLFLSDGEATQGGNALDDVPCVPTPATFFTIAAGSGSSCTNTGGGRGSLQQIAADTGGTCTHVTNLATLPDVVPGLIDSQLTAIEISVDGGAPVPVDTTSSPLPVTGPATVDWSHDLNLAPGVYDVCVTAHGSDAGGSGSVIDCHAVTVAEIGLSPATETNDLSSETSHTVTATVSAGSDGGVSGVTVDFVVTSGPNAGASGQAVTDANGEATFTWTNPNQNASGLGTDTVVASFTDDFGNVSSADAEKTWADLSAPEPACTAGPNPNGNRPPGARPQGTTVSHGYFTVSATDVIDPDPQVFVRDTGSGTVFGPFASPTNIKWTQAPGGTPGQQAMGGPNSVVPWHLTGNGDAEVFAVDASGNVSDPVLCTVPPQ